MERETDRNRETEKHRDTETERQRDKETESGESHDMNRCTLATGRKKTCNGLLLVFHRFHHHSAPVGAQRSNLASALLVYSQTLIAQRFSLFA